MGGEILGGAYSVARGLYTFYITICFIPFPLYLYVSHILCAEGEMQTLSGNIDHGIEADVTRNMCLHSYFWESGWGIIRSSVITVNSKAYSFYVRDVG